MKTEELKEDAKKYNFSALPLIEGNNTPDAAVGDIVIFTEPFFEGSYPNSRFSHKDKEMCLIVKDSYGAKRAQHTFTLCILDSEGSTRSKGENFRKKARNIYGSDGYCLFPLASQEAREEKHQRGAEADANKRAIWNEEGKSYTVDEFGRAHRDRNSKYHNSFEQEESVFEEEIDY